MIQPTPWWDPAFHADRRPLLLMRNRIKTAFRNWFEADGFTEVDCAILQPSPGNEAHLHAFSTERIYPDGRRVPLYLHTSPEFAAKKLLAAGERKIFTFAPVFRNREEGVRHGAEFTMLEWYRVAAPYEALMEDCAALLRIAAEAAGATRLRAKGLEADPFVEPERITVAEAFLRFADIDLLATVDASGKGERDRLADAAERIGLRVAFDDTWSDVFSRVIVEKVEPYLGIGRPTILCEYPVIEAALARPKAGDPRVAERFELYACGVELANGFGELTDPAEQRRRFVAEMDEKEERYGERYPIDEDFLAALSIMPEASGIALGFDRLVMLATGASRIANVVWTPAPE